MSINAFTVVSEFKFDVAHAVVGSEQLQSKVDQLSNSASSALESVKALGIGFIANFSGAATGILGLLGNAINSSDKFTDSQLSFASIIDSNMNHLTGSIHGLNEQMAASKNIMNDIANDAMKFGLPAAELLEMTKGLSAMLVPKGLAGENFGNARTMSRNLLKSAPNLGIHPAEVQGQLLRSIEGSASMGDTLFRRLLSEAPEAFKANKVTDAKSFNTLDATKRFNILNDALAKFASNAGILGARANTLAGVMQRIKDLFSGFNSMLKPLGDVLLPFLVMTLNIGIRWLETKGRTLVKMMSNFIKPFLESPEQALIAAKQVSALGRDVKIATTTAGIVSLFEILKHVPFLGAVVTWFANLILSLFSLKAVMLLFRGLYTVLAFIWPVLNIFIGAIITTAGVVAVLTAALQGIERALARMEIETLQWIADNAVVLAENFGLIKDAFNRVMQPLYDITTGFEELVYAIIGGTYFLDLFKSGLEVVAGALSDLSGGFSVIYATFRAMVAGMFDVIFRAAENIGIILDNLKSGNLLDPLKGTKNVLAGYKEAFDEEFDKTMNKALAPNIDGSVDNNKVSNTVINQDIKMNNSFKEVLQPDRIAFTIADQLGKAARNKTQSLNQQGTLASKLSRAQ